MDNLPLAARFGGFVRPRAAARLGAVTSTEGRALHNIVLPRTGGASPEARGLNCFFAPQVNLLRDFRWGRNEEVLTECPYVVGELASQYTLGLQVGEAPQYLKVSNEAATPAPLRALRVAARPCIREPAA